jgi:hypothetical protein
MYTHFPSPSTVGYLIVFSFCIYTFGVHRYGKVLVCKALLQSWFLGVERNWAKVWRRSVHEVVRVGGVIARGRVLSH